MIGLMPEEENAFLIRGRLHEALGDDQAAEQDYEVVTGLNPFNEQAYLQLGTLYIAREQRDDRSQYIASSFFSLRSQIISRSIGCIQSIEDR